MEASHYAMKTPGSGGLPRPKFIDRILSRHRRRHLTEDRDDHGSHSGIIRSAPRREKAAESVYGSQAREPADEAKKTRKIRVVYVAKSNIPSSTGSSRRQSLSDDPPTTTKSRRQGHPDELSSVRRSNLRELENVRTPKLRTEEPRPSLRRHRTVTSSLASSRHSSIFSAADNSSTIKRSRLLEINLGSTPKKDTSGEKCVECTTCLDEVPISKCAKLDCGHRMCQSCLRRTFKLSTTDPQSPRPICCTKDPIPLKHVEKLFDTNFKRLWNQKFQDYTESLKTQPSLATKIQKGIRGMVKGVPISAIGDTGASENFAAEAYLEEQGITIKRELKFIKKGNSSDMVTTGTAEIPFAFQDNPGKIFQITVRAVRNCIYDLILGDRFLQETETMTTYLHRRFVPCKFRLRSLWSFNLAGDSRKRFRVTLGGKVPSSAFLDTGADRFVMNQEWAQRHGFPILSNEGNCNWLYFMDGDRARTVGQVFTSLTLQDGKRVNATFEILPNCAHPVILPMDFIMTNNVYKKYASSLCESDDELQRPELLGMSSKPVFVRATEKALSSLNFRSRKATTAQGTAVTERTNSQVDEEKEMDRQLQWNRTYQGGRTATLDEYHAEDRRREAHEKNRRPGWVRQPGTCLIPYRPRAAAVTGVNFGQEEEAQWRGEAVGHG